MLVEATVLPEVLVLTPEVVEDARGVFFEAFSLDRFHKATGTDLGFVQDNQSRSVAGVLRGIHYQLPHPQGKLVRTVAGSIFDVSVDLRRSSPTFGQWAGTELSAANRHQVWIPPGFGHGFLALTDAEVVYKLTDYYAPGYEHTIAWDDPDLDIAWPLAGPPLLSVRDSAGAALTEATLFD